MTSTTLAVVAVAAAAAAAPPGARADDYCCVAAGLSASYDAAGHRIGAHWTTPVSGATAVELRVADRLDPSGIAALGPRTVRARAGSGSASVGAGPLAVVLAAHGGVFVQVRFGCPARTTGPPCASRVFWSKPFHLTADEQAAPAKEKPESGPATTQTRVQIASNGTKACTDAFAGLRTVIAALNANTQAALKAKAEHRDTAPYSRRQATLKARFDTLYAHAKAVCAKR